MLVDRFKGYVTKPDETNTSARFLVSGSQNVLVDDQAKISSRKGFSLYGPAGTATAGIVSSETWNKSSNGESPIRTEGDGIWVAFTTADGSVTWNELEGGFTNIDFVFTTWWDSSAGIDKLVMVNGTANLYSWRGAIDEVASVTSNTIVIKGLSVAESRFTTGSGTLIIGTAEYAYTGSSAQTFTGVTPDPSAAGVADTDVVMEKIVTDANKPSSGFLNDAITVERNQLYVLSNTSRDVHVSKTTDFADFTTATVPRVVGEASLLTLDNAGVGFANQEGSVYIGAGKDDLYRVTFTLSSNNAAEALDIEKLKTAPLQAPLTHDTIAKVKNDVVFITNEPTLETLGRIENINTPQSKPISDPIKPDFDALDTTNAHVHYHKTSIYIAIPNEGKVLIFDMEKGYWQPPQLLPVSRLETINGDLYGHSSVTNETYLLFADNVYDDNGGGYTSKAIFAYRHYGDRANLKNFDEWYSEGYISSGTVLNLEMKYEYKGSDTIKEFDIKGNDSSIIFESSFDNSLGKESIGKEPTGGSKTAQDELAKFRVINTTKAIDFYEIQTTYGSSSNDQRWQLLAQGGNIRGTASDNIGIKK